MKTIIAVAVAAVFTAPALAQDKPAPPPAWKQGMPAKMKDSRLAPHAGKMTETPASEIPVSKLKVPAGFKVEVWSTGHPGGRAMATISTPAMELVLLVDDILAVETLPLARLRESGGTLVALPGEYVQGVVEWGAGLLVVLDLPTLLADERLIIQQEVA